MLRHPLTAVLSALALSVVAAACGAVEGQTGSDADFPDRPIKWIVTFDPGGGSDTDFRRLQPHLEEALGVKVEVEYLTGADGAIGWAELVNAKPDGYTIGSIVLPHIILQPLSLDEAGYKTEQFAPISMNARAPQVLFVSAKKPSFESFEDFEAAAKADPGKIDIGGGAEFNAGHAAWAQLNNQGLETNFVSGGGGATEVVASVLGGHIPVGITSAQQAVGSEEIKPIAVFSDEEYELLPGVPTAKSLGYDVVQETNWGTAAPEGTPDDQREIIWEAIEEALEQDEVLENMTSEGQEKIGLGPSETEDYIADTSSRIEEILPLLEKASN